MLQAQNVVIVPSQTRQSAALNAKLLLCQCSIKWWVVICIERNTNISYALLQSSECQTADWTSHKSECIPETVVGIVIHCDGEKQNSQTGLFSTIEIGRTHSIHSKGDVCPVSQIVRLPIIMFRHIQEDPLEMPRSEALDNQRATYLMINPVDGFAPPR